METIGWIFVIIFVCAILGGPSYDAKYDSTDHGKKHSGLRVIIDEHTGCHYLVTWLGGITPRLDNEGKQVCDRDRSKHYFKKPQEIKK